MPLSVLDHEGNPVIEKLQGPAIKKKARGRRCQGTPEVTQDLTRLVYFVNGGITVERTQCPVTATRVETLQAAKNGDLSEWKGEGE